MKKILALALAVMLVMAMSVNAMAAMTDDKTSGDVVVNVTIPAGDVYKIDISWTDLKFTYSFQEWDTSKLTYKDGTWDKTTATVTVSNSSNVAIQVTGALADKDIVSGVTATLSGNEFVLPVGQPNGSAPVNTMTLTVGGKPANAVNVTNQVVGTITVTLVKVANP